MLKEPILVTLWLTDVSEGDPADYDYPTAMEAPWRGYDSAWQVVASMPDATVGTVFTFRGQRMKLVQNEKRRAIGIQNKHTGKVDWISMDQAPFGADQIAETLDLGDYRTIGIATRDTKLARTLQKDSARTPSYSVFEKWKTKGADLKHRSSFKHPYQPRRIR